MQQIYDSEKSLAVAQKAMSKIDYEILLEKTLSRKSTVKLKLPVMLYSAENEILDVKQRRWNYIQRIQTAENLNCYSFVAIEKDFSLSALQKFYCFDDKKFIGKTDLKLN